MSKIIFYNFLYDLVIKRYILLLIFKLYAEVHMFCYNLALIANCLLKDDLELEIMINTPPAPSVESLALAHHSTHQDNPQGPTSPPSLRFSPDTKGIFATHSFQLSWRFYFRVLLQKLDSSLDDRSLITNKVVFEIPQFAKHCILS